MAIPTLQSVLPAVGPTSGGDLVRLTGAGFAARVAVRIGGEAAEVLGVRDEAGTCIVDARTPPHDPAVVDVELQNLTAEGTPVPGEVVVIAAGYRYERPRVAREADVTRLVRQLLRTLKRHIVQNVSSSVAVDYDDTTVDGLNITAMATLPSLILAGPALRENRLLRTNVPHEDVVVGSDGPEIVRRKAPYTVDLVFGLTAASRRTAELLNLLAAVAAFVNRNHWIELQRDPDRPERGTVRWEMGADGEFRVQLASKDDVRTFTGGVVVFGFDLDEGLPHDIGKAVRESELQIQAIPGGVS